MQTDKKAKKATTLLELLISVVLLSIMVVFAICIMGISGSAASESASELQVLNAYDIFLDTYVDAVKNAYDVSVADGTRLFLATPTATHTFEFIHNRLYMDEEELLKAGNGSFAYGSGYVTLRMQPEGYGTIELKIAPDVSPDAAPQITPVQERKIRAIRVLSFPYKVTYLHGETIDTSGLTLELLYSDGTKEIVDSGYSTTPITANYSSPFFTVTYDGGEQPFTSAIPLDVYRNLANVTVVSEQNQKDYSVGETFNPDGLRLKVSYSDGNSEIISSGFDCADISDKPPGSAANRISFTHRDTTMSVLVPVRIFAVIRTVPSQDGTLTYNTAVQSPAWKDYDSGALTIGGTTSGQNAGEYTASFTPKGYNWWSDRTQDARTAAWVIAKAQQTIAVPSDTVSIHIGKTEDIFAVSGVLPGGSEAGTISYTSDDPAKAAVDTETGKVTAVSPGTCTVRIVAEETANICRTVLM